MWMFTVDGFYSVVQDRYCEQGELTVRARCLVDLEHLQIRLREWMGIEAATLEIKDADYRYRMTIPREAWGEYLKRSAEEINYNNFKFVALKNDPPRSRAYHSCWAALRDWQDEARRKGGKR